MGKMLFLATFQEFEVDLLGCAPARAWPSPEPRGRLRGRQSKLSAKQQAELRQMHAVGDYSISDPAGLLATSRPTVYRTLAAHARPAAQQGARR